MAPKKATKKKSTKPAKRPALGKLRSTAKLAQKKCPKGSLRAVMPPGRPEVRIIICCPPTKWSAKKAKCAVSLKAHLKKKYTLKRK